MKTILKLLTVSFLCLLFYGCPYTSPVPITEPKMKIKTQLLGTWKESKETEDSVIILKTDPLVFSKKDDTHYTVSTIGDDKEPGYTAHLSKVSGDLFLNTNISEEVGKVIYTFYKVKFINKNELKLIAVSDVNIKEQFTTSNDLKKFIKANNSKKLYGNGDVEEDTFVLKRIE